MSDIGKVLGLEERKSGILYVTSRESWIQLGACVVAEDRNVESRNRDYYIHCRQVRLCSFSVRRV